MEISVSEAAKQLNISSRHVLNLIRGGKLKARPKTDAPHSHLLVEQQSVDDYLARLKNLGQ